MMNSIRRIFIIVKHNLFKKGTEKRSIKDSSEDQLIMLTTERKGKGNRKNLHRRL